MAIPGGILFARILSPATEPRKLRLKICRLAKHRQKALLSCGERCNDRAENRRRCGYGGMAFVAIIALINGIIGGIGGCLVLPIHLWKVFLAMCWHHWLDHGCGLE